MNNENLQAAKRAKNDEFYTRIEDIDKEVSHYWPQLKGKTVYLNCDSTESNFWKYFHDHFKDIGLKELRSTYKTLDGSPSYLTVYDGLRDYRHKLDGDGAFQSPECYAIMQMSDVIITNPPFSQFREYITMILLNNKKFIVLGHQNAIKYKNIFPYIKRNKIFLGVSIHSGDVEFEVPDYYPIKTVRGREENGHKYIRVTGIRWFSNIKTDRVPHLLPLLKEKYDPLKYKKLDNYDAINVDRTKQIPNDFFGVIAAPITFLDYYNEEEFKIIDEIAPIIDGKKIYARLLIQRKL